MRQGRAVVVCGGNATEAVAVATVGALATELLAVVDQTVESTTASPWLRPPARHP